jgi:methionyl-tRNA formyltransferase
MKIIFMGTPDFAIPSLKILLEGKHDVIAVVTGEDKERGRGQKMSFTSVKEFTLKYALPILQPEKLKNPDFINSLKEFSADLFVVVAFRILPNEVFTIPPKGSFNLHASILPKYRGAAPIQWALINGEKETGVTTFALEKKVDTGNIILQEKIIIDDEDNFETLHDKLSELGAKAVLQTVDLIESGKYELKSQDNSLATPAPKITKEIAKISWDKSAGEIHNLIRGLSPFPAAYFIHKGKIIKIYKSKVDKSIQLQPGEIKLTKEKLYIGCKSGSLEILELQQEGRKKLSTEEFLRGFSFN